MPCTSKVLYSVKVALHFHRMLYKYQLRMRKNVPQLRLHSSLTDNQIQYYVNWLLFSTCKCQPQSVFFYTHPFFLHLSYLTVIQTLLPRVCMYSKGLSNHVVCLSVCPWTKILKQLKCTVIRSEKGTITTFELFFEGHSADSVIYNLWEPQIQSFEFSYYSSPTPPL